MVRLKDKAWFLSNGSISIQGWLQDVETRRSVEDLQIIHHACSLAQLTEGSSSLQQGIIIADLLLDLSVDSDAVAAGIVYGCVQNVELTLEDVAEHLGQRVAKLVQGVMQMEAIRFLDEPTLKNQSKVENVRKMLLAMVEDIRVVLIKLAESVYLLRAGDNLPAAEQMNLARHIFHLYAPLANRLGLSRIKWELEDRTLRYLNPTIYQKISTSLSQSRIKREQYIVNIISQLREWLAESHIQKPDISGRVKHIYGIYRKMMRKNVEYNEIYDANAVRVIVNTVEDCYTVLSIVHTKWEPIKKEFDDYIATPKLNGYQSIHTAVITDYGHILEVQIRTCAMHQASELGNAAHWRYKEGVSQTGYDAKIAWLRQILEWQKELTTEQQQTNLLDDRAYVFTPTGEIVDLPQGATPLDFAYAIHSEVGHRCRGAKVNGHIVTLISSLQTGDRVEILTAKQPAPSRDWLNPHLGYLTTTRARAKVHHWFKKQDFDKNLSAGRVILEKELTRLSLAKPDYEKVARELNFHKADDMLAALGCGDIRLAQILYLMGVESVPIKKISTPSSSKKTKPSSIYIYGVGNLLTQIAKCCKPLPGEEIIGYITPGRGVVIHRQACVSVAQAKLKKPERLVETSWGEKPTTETHAVNIEISAYERPGLIRDITLLLTNEKINFTALNTRPNTAEHMMYANLTIEINSVERLTRLITRIKQLPNIVDVNRLA
ncbi:MAG: RelA/SpoT family protein [Gammaproteobacteria bacterium]